MAVIDVVPSGRPRGALRPWVLDLHRSAGLACDDPGVAAASLGAVCPSASAAPFCTGGSRVPWVCSSATSWYSIWCGGCVVRPAVEITAADPRAPWHDGLRWWCPFVVFRRVDGGVFVSSLRYCRCAPPLERRPGCILQSLCKARSISRGPQGLPWWHGSGGFSRVKRIEPPIGGYPADRTSGCNRGKLWLPCSAVGRIIPSAWYSSGPVPTPAGALVSAPGLSRNGRCTLSPKNGLLVAVCLIPVRHLGRPVLPQCGIIVVSSVHRRPCTVRSHRKTGEATGLKPSLAPTKRGLTP